MDITNKNPNSSACTVHSFGNSDGCSASLYTIQNREGCMLSLTDFGATIVSCTLPSGYDCIVGDKHLQYFTQQAKTPHFGASIGRLAGRTGLAPITINTEQGAKTFTLKPNEGRTAHLHGGGNGIDSRVWNATPYEHAMRDSVAYAGVQLSIVSPDGDNGYPGTVSIIADIGLSLKTNTIRIEYQARSDIRTPINVTNHAYFRLAGTDIQNHRVTIHADEVYAFDEHGIVTGTTIPVESTPWDLRTPTELRVPITALQNDRKGIDYIWKLSDTASEQLRHAATLVSPDHSVSMETHTTSPALVCYTSNYLGDYKTGERDYKAYEAICFETQYASGFLHQPAMPQSFVSPASPWKSVTEYRFK